MTAVEASLTIVKDWQKKSYEFSRQSKDRLLPLMTNAFDTMIYLLDEDAERDDILCSLLNLDSQRSITMRFENSKSPDAVRTLVYGIIQSLQLTLLQLTEKGSSDQTPTVHSTMEQCTQTEIIRDDLSVANDNPSTSNAAEGEDFTLPVFTLVFPKAEDFGENTHNFDNSESNDHLGDGTIFKNEDMLYSHLAARENEDTHADHQFAEIGDEIDGEEVEEDEDIDYDVQSTSQPAAKKAKKSMSTPQSTQREEAETSSSTIFKPSDTDMLCPEPGCDYLTNRTRTWLSHLRSKHNTTPDLANVALRCECGHQCLSWTHSERCAIANFVVFRTREGPIRRLNSVNAALKTPQCIFPGCDKRPNTLSSFDIHLKREHDSSLKQAGYYLRCECGDQVRSKAAAYSHNLKKCGMRNFTLHKVDQK